MTAPILQTVPPDIDEARVGISYSGGGPLLLIELGIAQAFVDLRIKPAAIAGVSAGAIAAAAHAFDPVNGTAIKAASEAVLTLSDHRFGLTPAEIAARFVGSVVTGFKLPISLGDNAPIQPTVEGVFGKLMNKPQLTVGELAQHAGVPLYIGGTDRSACERFWFPASAEVADALVASSAIPGVFPPRKITIGGQEMVFVDGAVAQNQPLSELVLQEKCGTLYACAVGYDGEPMGEPRDALDNAMSAITILSHEASRLEQGYVECKFAQVGKGHVYHVHPPGPFNISSFNFTADEVKQVMELACQQTKDWIRQQGWMPPGVTMPVAASVGS